MHAGALCKHTCGSLLHAVMELLQAQIAKEKQGEWMLEKNKPSRAVRMMALLEKQYVSTCQYYYKM